MISVTNQRAGLILSQAAKYIMESKDYSHYNHTDACRYYRWTARESYQFMYSRPWQKVVDFYSNVVNGHTYLPELFGAKVISSRTRHIPDDAENLEFCEKSEIMRIPSKEKSGRWERVTFKIVLSYHGGSFDGWQKQPGLNTVQGLLEASLGKFVDEKKAAMLRDKGLPVEACIVVAGRTDKGVTASQQVCSFYTWRKDVKVQDIEDAINCTIPGKLRVISVAEVSRMFHPNFSAKWRRYLYIFPFNDDGERGESSQIEGDVNIFYNESEGGKRHNFDASCDKEHLDCLVDNDIDEVESRRKSASFRVSKVDTLLRQLEGRSLSYKIFARDTKPSRNIGPPTECFIFHARAVETTLPCDTKDGEHTKAMCVELVGNRFLRKMVRVLVATSIREAAAGAEDDALIKLMDATCRRATSPPAPPDGLCLVDVGYEEFDPRSCLIN